MGFEINSNHKPIITGAQGLTDGGAGNLGYFEHEKEKKEKEKDKSIFSEKETKDSFNKSGENLSSGDDFSISTFIAEIIFTVKNWLKKTFNIK